MNSLQTTPKNGRLPAINQTADPLTNLPTWLRYLAGAFPAAKVTSATFMVYEDQFSDADPALMLTAVRQAVKAHTWGSFPAVAELRRLVDGLEYETVVANRPAVNLNQVRHQLMQAAYGGKIDPAAWTRVYRHFIAHKRLESAHALTVKYQRFTGEALTR